MVVTRLVRAATVLGTMAVMVGIVGVILAEGNPTTPRGTLIGWPQIEVVLVSFNRLGAAVTTAAGGMAILAARIRSAPLLAATAVVFAVMAAQVVVQWGRGANLLGGSGQNLSLWMALAAGLGVLAWALRVTSAEKPGRGS
jgi:hypothetical protein